MLSNSEFTQKNVKKAYGIESKVSYLGVDTDFFKPEKSKKDIDVLYIGAKDQVDGYDLLKNALNLIPEKLSVKYHVTGEGWMSDADLKRLYNRAKIVVCLANNEPFGLIPLEAAACGVPVIALNSGGYKETVINERTGYLIEQDSKKLAEKIQYLLSFPDQLIEMGKNARRIVESKWNWDTLSAEVEKVFKELAKEN